MKESWPAVLCLFLFLAGVGYAFRRAIKNEKLKKPSEVQEPGFYLPLVSPPDHLPVRFQAKYIHHYVLGVIICVFFLATAYLCMVKPDLENRFIGIVFLLIFAILTPMACFNTGKKKKRLCLELDAEFVRLGNEKINHKDIRKIYFKRIKERDSQNRVFVSHHIIVEGAETFLKIRLGDFKKRQLAEMINCCLYHNPSIAIDETAGNIMTKTSSFLGVGFYKKQAGRKATADVKRR